MRIISRAEWPLTRALRALADWLPTPAAASEPTRGAEGPLYCGDCKHPAHSGPCPVLHFYDRPSGPPGNQQCMCGHYLQPASPAAPAPRVLTREQVMGLWNAPRKDGIVFSPDGMTLDAFIARLRELGIEVEGA